MLADRPLLHPVRTLHWFGGSVQMGEPKGFVQLYTKVGLVLNTDSLLLMSVRNYRQKCTHWEGHLGLYLSA